MISIIITSFKEPKTGKAIESFLNQKIREKHEIIVSAPDIETQNIVKRYKQVKLFKDPGKGKSPGGRTPRNERLLPGSSIAGA